MIDQPAFGRRLKELRLARGLSQAKLAGTGMSTGYLSRLESGARPPTRHAVSYLAGQLGVEPTEFEERDLVEAASLARALANATALPTDTAVSALSAAVESAAPDVDAGVRWNALWFLADVAGRHGDREAELRLLREAAALADQLQESRLRARARAQLARCLRAVGESEEAIEAGTEALRIADEAELEPADIGSSLLALVAALAEAGRIAEARTLADRMCALAPQLSGTLRVEVLWAASTMRVRQGDGSTALEYLEQAITALDEAGEQGERNVVLWFRLRVAAASLLLQISPQDPARAGRHLQEAAGASQIIQAQRHRSELMVVQAQLAFVNGDSAEAQRLCDELAGHESDLTYRDRSRLDMLRNQLLIAAGEVEEGMRNLQALALRAQQSLNLDLAADIWRAASVTLAQVHAPVAER